MIRYHVGIDVGKSKHHACVLDTIENRYTKVFPFTVDRQDFERFLLFLFYLAFKMAPIQDQFVKFFNASLLDAMFASPLKSCSVK